MASLFQKTRDLLSQYRPVASSVLNTVKQTVGNVAFGKFSSPQFVQQNIQKPIQTFSEKYVRSPQGEFFPQRVSKLPVAEQNKAFRTLSEDFAFGGLTAPQAATKTVLPAIKPVVNNTQQYIQELVQKQQIAKKAGTGGIKARVGKYIANIKAGLVDETSPIQDVLTQAEKKYKFKTLPTQDVRLQIDRVLRSKNLASQFAKDNGLVDVIKSAPDLNALDQYMIAKQAKTVGAKGFKTGRNALRDEQLISDLAPTYEPFARQVNQYSRKLLDYSVNAGLIDKDLATRLIQEYPEYVPLQRVFNELEKSTIRGVGKGVASLSSQSVVQRLKGSEREIASPIESLLLKTQDALSQGERNIAARQLASYEKLPGFEGLIKEVDVAGKDPHTFSFIDKGIKRVFATTPEIEAAAKALNVEQMGLLGKIISIPTRVLQLGATGLNIPFVVTNMLKDEVVGFVNSSKAAKTSLLNPANYIKALFSALKHDELYDEVVRSAAGGTTFDIAREAPDLSVKAIRSTKNLPSRIKYLVTNPKDLLRAVEDIVGRGEELGRIKNYRGTKEALLKEGRNISDATLLGAQAARENTANFARRGSWGRVLNWVIPFFNAGIQGARQLVTSFSTKPAQTAAKVGITIFTPVAASVAWNLSDPERKAIYMDIPEYEKENNLILIPPNATQDEKGRWNVIKIPLPPGLSNLGSLVRRPLEAAEGLDPVRFGEIASNLITAGTSIDLSSTNKIASTFTPQIAKPFVESVTNTNLFTGTQIVPEYMKNRPASEQYKAATPEIAKKLGGALNISPLKIENFAQSQLGGLGAQLLGKESALGNLERRFSKASAGVGVDRIYDDAEKYRAIDSQIKTLVKEGNKDKAKAIIQKNKELLVRGEETVKFQTKLKEYYSDRNKVLNSNLPQEKKKQVLTAIQGRITGLSRAYFNFLQTTKKAATTKKTSSLVERVGGLLSKIKIPEASASEGDKQLTELTVEGDRVKATYKKNDGTYVYANWHIDKDIGVIGSTIGKTLDSIGKKLGIKEMGASEKFGYEDKAKRIEDLLARGKQQTGPGFDQPMQQPRGLVAKEKKPTKTPYDKEIQEAFGDQWENATRVLNFVDEDGIVRGENTQFKAGREVDTSNEGYETPSSTKKSPDDVQGSDGNWYSLDRGLFRINSRTFHDFLKRKGGLMKSKGINSYDDMLDPLKNAYMAQIIYDEQGWDAWYAAPADLISEKGKQRRKALGMNQ